MGEVKGREGMKSVGKRRRRVKALNSHFWLCHCDHD